MPWLTLPLNAPLTENVDDVAKLDGRAAERADIYIDEEGASHKRPGTSVQDSSFASGLSIQSEYEWIRKSWMVLVTGGVIYIKKSASLTPIKVNGATLDPDNPVTFADNGSQLVMANGDKMVYIDNGDFTTAVEVTDPQAPTKVSFVAHINGFILALEDDTDNVFNSDLDDATSWASAQQFSAESNPDKALSMTTDQGLIYIWGEKTLEIWYPNGSADVTPFSRQDVVPHGIVAKRSFVKANNTFYWFNQERRFVYLNGATVQSISLPFDKVHHDLEVINDAESYLLTAEGKYFIVINFPTEDRSHVYDVAINQWYRWGYWDNRNANLDRLMWSSIVTMQNWGKTYAGSRLGDSLLVIDADNHDDVGRQIRPEFITGHLLLGGMTNKKMPRMRLQLKRGDVMLDTSDLDKTPKLIMQYRKNGGALWSNEREIDLGQLGETEMFVTINRLGQGRSIQFRFYMSDAAPFILTAGQIYIKQGRD
jgi:hypothetical protein